MNNTLKKSLALGIALVAIGVMSVSDAEARAGRHRGMAVGAGVAALVGGLMLGQAFANKGNRYDSGYQDPYYGGQQYGQQQYYNQQPVYYGNNGYQGYETVTVYQPVTTYRKVKVKRPVQVQNYDPYYGGGYNGQYVGY